MERLHAYIRLLLIILSLLGIQYIIGKKGSFPYGILVGLSPVFIGALVLLSDIILIPVALFLLEQSQRIRLFVIIHNKLVLNENRLQKSLWLRRIQGWGKWGVVVVVALPFSGGVWTGAILSHLMGLSLAEKYFGIVLGSALGSAIFVLGSLGVIHWVF